MTADGEGDAAGSPPGGSIAQGEEMLIWDPGAGGCGRNVARSDLCLGLSFVSLLCTLSVIRSLGPSWFQSARCVFLPQLCACLSRVYFHLSGLRSMWFHCQVSSPLGTAWLHLGHLFCRFASEPVYLWVSLLSVLGCA